MPDRFYVLGLTIILGLIGACLLLGGIILASAGGSLYYIAAGGVTLAAGYLLWRRKALAIEVFAGLLAITIVWALTEVALDGWALAPRLIAPAVLALAFLAPPIRRAIGSPNPWWIGVPILAVVVVMGGAATRAEVSQARLPPAKPITESSASYQPWKHWGRTLGGDRYAPETQINVNNVQQLKLAWRFDSDVPPFAVHSFQATPLAIDGKLYVCLDRGVVVALGENDGHEIWRHDPGISVDGLASTTCRGVSYHEAPNTASCAKRILYGTPDGNLVALDALTGLPCDRFGNKGVVDLRDGMGPVNRGETLSTSPPPIINGVAVVGQFVLDTLSVDAPSGVVRGYDAETGKLRWAWDIGRPGQPILKPGETYTRNTPNAWSVLSGDEKLGLVFVPTGNSTPDNYGARRSPESEKYSSSIVAIDVATGRTRWSFQTVHHDLWDYDAGSQPVAVDLPGPQGPIPALIVPTKRGELFVLDRRTGAPIDPVEERPVPQGGEHGDWTAKTQPYSNGFPSLAGPDLTEADMWGITPLDQLWCRIKFKQARYEGQFTPPGERPSIVYPGSAGGSDWGSVTIDLDRKLMVANSLRMADTGASIMPDDAKRMQSTNRVLIFPQAKTPRAFRRGAFTSPLGAPCQRPPYGLISVFDLNTRKLLWSEPLGTAAKSGPLGLESMLPIKMGAPNMGGSVATAGGLIFIAASQDRMLRAFDIGNGRELWRAELPAAGVATPMTFSSKRGRQYVVIASGGYLAFGGPQAGALLAYALPEQPDAK